MATPFSPFVGRPKPAVKRRQSELPSDLIDWDAPEIPEVEKQRIIYEDVLNELKEDHVIETLLNEQMFSVAHGAIVDEFNSKLEAKEAQLQKEQCQVSLLLNQLRMFEQNVRESTDRVDELEAEITSQRDTIASLEQEREDWLEERSNLQGEIENLNFRNNETTCELNHNLEIYIQKKNEAEDMKKKFEAVKNQLSYYKKLAKNRDQDENE